MKFRNQKFETGVFFSHRSNTLVLNPVKIGNNYVTKNNVYTTVDLQFIAKNWEELIIISFLLKQSRKIKYGFIVDLNDYDCCCDGYCLVKNTDYSYFDNGMSNWNIKQIMLDVPFNIEWHNDYKNITNFLRKLIQ